MSDFATSALEAANLGLAAFPCRPDSKVPAVKGWQRIATTDPEAIFKLAEEHPSANIGLAPSDWFGLDVDGSDGSARWSG